MADNFAEGTVELKAVGLDQIEAAMVKAAAVAKKTAEEMEGIERVLKKQIATFGMSSKEVQVWELRAKGATTGQINTIMALTKQYEKLAAKQRQQNEAVSAMAATKAAVDGVNAELKKQIDTIGMSAKELQAWELKGKGATTEQIRGVTALANQFEKLKEKQKAAADAAAELKATKTAVDESTEAMKKQIATFGMSGDEVKVWELKAKGATDSQIAELQKLQKEHKRLQDIQKKQADEANGKKKPTGVFDRLKGLASASSQITGMIGGLAAVGGITMAADAISTLAKEAMDLRGQFERGEITAGEFADSIARSIPVAGSLYSAVTDGTRAIQDFGAMALRAAGDNTGLAKAVESTATASARAKAEMDKLAGIWKEIADLRAKRLAGDGSLFSQDILIREESDGAREALEKQLPAAGRTKKTEGWLWDSTTTTPLTKGEQAARKAKLDAINAIEQQESAKVFAPAYDEMIRLQQDAANKEFGRRDGIANDVESANDALLEQIALWGKVGRARERAALIINGARGDQLLDFDRNTKRVEQLEKDDKHRERAKKRDREDFEEKFTDPAIAGVTKAVEAFSGRNERLRKVKDDIAAEIKRLQENVDFKGMTEDQKTVERFRRSGAGEKDVAKLLAVQAKQEKMGAQTQFLSSSGVADYMQTAIGNAPDQKQALKAAQEAAEAAKVQAKCVDGGAVKVKIVGMPSMVATYS